MENPLAVVQHGALIEDRGADICVPWWSFTKTVIAAAALVLVRDGHLALDQPCTNRAFTLRQLLQHRAGVSNYGELADYHAAVAQDADPWPVATLLERTQADRLRFAPDQGWAYSNIGYLVVRTLIEETRGEDLDTALHALVLEPLDIRGPRIAVTRNDLAEVEMGGGAYHPGWVYHGLMVGRVSDAALLLDRLMTGDLLPSKLHGEMRRGHSLGFPSATGRWRDPAYGLGLMCDTARDDGAAFGHTGGGPGSAIAVYHFETARPMTVAAFAFGNEPARVGEVEEIVLAGARP